jgi:hypothetical protein
MHINNVVFANLCRISLFLSPNKFVFVSFWKNVFSAAPRGFVFGSFWQAFCESFCEAQKNHFWFGCYVNLSRCFVQQSVRSSLGFWGQQASAPPTQARCRDRRMRALRGEAAKDWWSLGLSIVGCNAGAHKSKIFTCRILGGELLLGCRLAALACLIQALHFPPHVVGPWRAAVDMHLRPPKKVVQQSVSLEACLQPFLLCDLADIFICIDTGHSDLCCLPFFHYFFRG